tara:strand:- start:267 stop:473 length:207 start_codon:yes stop_codon:yes gene_type:complete
MKAIHVINYIASNPNIKNVVINSEDDKTPMQAIEYLSVVNFENNVADFRINNTLEKGTLLVYDNFAKN